MFQFSFPSFLLPGYIRLKEKVRHIQLGHHPKGFHLAYTYPERGKGFWEGSFSNFPLFFPEDQMFVLDFPAEAYGTSTDTAWWHKSQFKHKGWSQRLVSSCNSVISEDLSSIVHLNKCHCGLTSVLSGGSPKH